LDKSATVYGDGSSRKNYLTFEKRESSIKKSCARNKLQHPTEQLRRKRDAATRDKHSVCHRIHAPIIWRVEEGPQQYLSSDQLDGMSAAAPTLVSE